MMDKNEFNFRNRFAGVITVCVWLCVILLEVFCRIEIIETSPESPANFLWFFWITYALLWMVAPYFRDYFDDFQSSGYTPLIEKNDLYFRLLFIGAMFVCFLLCLLLLDKFVGTSLMVWLLDNLWIFGVIAGSSWVISPYVRNYFGIFRDSSDE